MSAKRSRSVSLDKPGPRHEARAPVLLVPRPPSIDVGAGASASRSDHRRHVLDAVRILVLHAGRSHSRQGRRVSPHQVPLIKLCRVPGLVTGGSCHPDSH